MKRILIFVYGTLLPGQSNHGIIAPHAISSRPGRIRGRMVNVGRYPALLLESEHSVRGEWMEVALAGLPALDALEEFGGIEERNDYERVWITDADDQAISGWVYIWTETRGFPYLEEDWWPDVYGIE